MGGYYDAGDNVNIGEHTHIRDLIKWGTDYLLLTFNSNATKIDHKIYCQVLYYDHMIWSLYYYVYVYCTILKTLVSFPASNMALANYIDLKLLFQVGGAQNGSTTLNDEYCWQKLENLDYPRPTQTCYQGPDLASEIAAAFAAASIVLQDDSAYSWKLIRGAETVFAFARDKSKRRSYSRDNPYISPYYNSTGYYEEYIWGATWLYYTTGNSTYISLATKPSFSRHSKAFFRIPKLRVPSWLQGRHAFVDQVVFIYFIFPWRNI